MFDNAKEIDLKQLKEFNKELEKDEKAQLLRNAISRTTIKDAIYNQDKTIGLEPVFNIEVKTMSVTNQLSSGRCWLFAATNVLREIVAKKLNLEKFELSQNFMAFYDKLEKINYALEACIDFMDKDPDDRVVAHVLNYPVSDGGQWDMFKDLVKKYGVCPKTAMPETYVSSHTAEHNFIINNAVRKFASIARHMYLEGRQNEVRELKDKVLKELYRSLVIVFGKPCEVFDFEYKDKDGVYHLDKNITPKEFFDKYVGIEIDDYISIINSPTKDKPFYKMFTLDYVGNVIGGSNIHHLNLPMERIKELVINQLKNDEIVWFGSDCGKYSDPTMALWDNDQFDYNLSFNLDFSFTKADALDFHYSSMNHAMVITGVNLKDDKPNKWKIENSWGDKGPNQGYYTASDKWFDDFVYQVVVNKKYLNEKELKALKEKPIHLSPWDPMGTLA